MKRIVFLKCLLVIACWLAGAAITANAQSNLVYNPSFEPGYDGGWDSNVTVGNSGLKKIAPDGVAWLLWSGTNAMVWQDVPTVPGKVYRVWFTFGPDMYSIPNVTAMTVHFGDQVLGTVTNSIYDGWVRHTNFTGVAVSNSTRIIFELHEGIGRLDAVLVGWNEEPPSILVQPEDRRVLESWTTGFSVSPQGATPFGYQWYFENQAIAGGTERTLSVTNVQNAVAGSYHVVVSNAYGAVTSRVAQLEVDQLPKAPIITYQPRTQTLPNGYGGSFLVAAIGEQPLSYQWKLNGTNLPGETGTMMVISSFGATNAGSYTVVVSNSHGTDESVPAVLTVTNAVGGAYLVVQNRFGATVIPVYDVDGVTKLQGTNFLAQVYIGPDEASLLPLGAPGTFATAPFAGMYNLGGMLIPNVAQLTTAYVQIRAWDRTKGRTYEEAEFSGGRYGKSPILTFITPQATVPPSPTRLTNFVSFKLQPARLFFPPAKITMGGKLPNGKREWILTGKENSHYVVEKKNPPNDWVPMLVVFNETGTVTFVDPDPSNSSVKFYRARLLD